MKEKFVVNEQDVSAMYIGINAIHVYPDVLA